MNIPHYPAPVYSLITIALALVIGGDIVALMAGLSPFTVSLLDTLLIAIGWWAFSSEP